MTSCSIILFLLSSRCHDFSWIEEYKITYITVDVLGFIVRFDSTFVILEESFSMYATQKYPPLHAQIAEIDENR